MFESKRAIAEYYGRDGHDVMVLLTLRGYENAIKVLGTQGKSYFTFVDKLAVSGKPVRKAWIITYEPDYTYEEKLGESVEIFRCGKSIAFLQDEEAEDLMMDLKSVRCNANFQDVLKAFDPAIY